MDNIVFLKGERIHLRALMEKDLTSSYLQWLNDEEVCRNNSHAVFPNTEQRMKTYYNSIQNQLNVVLAIIHSDTDRHIGNVSLLNINWISRNAEFAILMGEKDFWGKGYGKEAARLIVQYGFERLNLHRIYCGTLNGNSGMIKLAASMGMKEEGRRREAIFKNGKYVDILEYGILYHEFFSSDH
jgi:[ribosomal protein S5]-alanine N-acetyltransferase